jgi:hypothetical protein
MLFPHPIRPTTKKGGAETRPYLKNVFIYKDIFICVSPPLVLEGVHLWLNVFSSVRAVTWSLVNFDQGVAVAAVLFGGMNCMRIYGRDHRSRLQPLLQQKRAVPAPPLQYVMFIYLKSVLICQICANLRFSFNICVISLIKNNRDTASQRAA